MEQPSKTSMHTDLSESSRGSGTGLFLRLLLMFAGTAGAFAFLTVAWQSTCGSLGIFGDCMPWIPERPLPTRSLLVGSPQSRDSSGQFGGYDRFTADELNHTYPGSSREAISGPLHYVPADVPSTGPTVVSVNPIDRFTWGAASLLRANGPCFLIVWTADRSNPAFGGARFGILPAGSTCLGAQATPDWVTARQWPFLKIRQPELIAQGGGLLTLGLILTVVIHALALRQRPQVPLARLLRWSLLAVGIVALVMGAEPLWLGLG